MKIVHILFSFTYGGIETMLVNILNEQCKHADVTIILINKHYSQTLIDKINKKVKFIKINRPPKSRNPYYIIKMNWLIGNIKPNIIHTHSSDIVRYLLPSFRKKAVNTIHDTPNQTHFPYIKYYLKVFAISKSVYSGLKEHGYNSIIVENGINPNSFFIREENSSDIFNIVQVGRLMHHKKGQDLMIKASSELVKRGITNFHIDFIGEGPSLEYLENLVYINKLDTYITFLGNKDTTYIETHLKNYSLLVQPSRIEGFGLTVTEAMAAKVPVLVSGQEGPMEIIANGQFGYYFKNENVEELADKIQEIMNKEIIEIKNLTEKAYQRVQECYNIKNTALKYLLEYRKED